MKYLEIVLCHSHELQIWTNGQSMNAQTHRSWVSETSWTSLKLLTFWEGVRMMMRIYVNIPLSYWMGYRTMSLIRSEEKLFSFREKCMLGLIHACITLSDDFSSISITDKSIQQKPFESFQMYNSLVARCAYRRNKVTEVESRKYIQDKTFRFLPYQALKIQELIERKKSFKNKAKSFSVLRVSLKL